MAKTLSNAIQFGRIAACYQQLRAEHPTVRALTIKRYINDDYGLSLDQFICETEWGHQFYYDDMDRSYCIHCGRDGDG